MGISRRFTGFPFFNFSTWIFMQNSGSKKGLANNEKGN